MDAHVGGVNDLVGCAAQGREEALFGLDAIHEGAGTLEGMGASIGFVAAHEGFGTGLEENDAVDNARALELFESGVQGAEEGTRAHVDTDGQAVHAGCGVVRHHADQRGKHRRGQVVNDVPVEVFQCTGGTGSSGTRVAGDDEDFVGCAEFEARTGGVTHGDALGEGARVLLPRGRGRGVGRSGRAAWCVVGHDVLLGSAVSA